MGKSIQDQAEAIDWEVFSAINGLAGRWRVLDAPVVALAHYGPIMIGLSLILLFFTGAGRARSRNRRLVARAALGFGVARLTRLAISRLYPRPRPYEKHVVHLLVKPTEKPSFPSNHMAESWAMAWGVHEGPRALAAPLLTLAFLVGVSRVYVGKHYPSDVVGGALIAIAADSLAGHILQLLTVTDAGLPSDD